MRILRAVTLLVIFTAFVFAGRSAGHSLRSRTQLRTITSESVRKAGKSNPNPLQTKISPSAENRDSAPAPSAEAPGPEPSGQAGAGASPWMITTDGSKFTNPPRQSNILLIGVDNLEAAKPKLEGVWLVLYITQTPHFTLMPIYPGVPAEDGKATKSDGDLAKLFQSDPAGVPGPGFFSELKDRGLWWSGYFIIDHMAMARIIDIVQRTAGAGQQSESASQALLDVPLAWKDPAGALLGQIQVAQKFCDEAAKLGANEIGTIDHLFLLFPDHILSDIPREQAAAEMVGMLVNNSQITCEFPTLATHPK